MAYEIQNGPITLEASTGLKQYRFVTVPSTGASAGKVAYPNASTLGQPVLGVITTEGTTGSTVFPQTVGVQIMGVVKVEAAASTMAAGNWVSASTIGQAQNCTNVSDSRVGLCIAGSSGGASRLITVALIPFGSPASTSVVAVAPA